MSRPHSRRSQWRCRWSQAKAKKHKPKVVGAVYSESNSVAKNRLYKYNRYDNGKLKLKQSVATGGRGSTQDFGCGPGCPILDSDSAVDISSNGKLVFAVNAGSDTVSSFRETSKGLKLVNCSPPAATCRRASPSTRGCSTC